MKELMIYGIKKIVSEEILRVLIDNLTYEDIKKAYKYVIKQS